MRVKVRVLASVTFYRVKDWLFVGQQVRNFVSFSQGLRSCAWARVCAYMHVHVCAHLFLFFYVRVRVEDISTHSIASHHTTLHNRTSLWKNGLGLKEKVSVKPVIFSWSWHMMLVRCMRAGRSSCWWGCEWPRMDGDGLGLVTRFSSSFELPP